MHRRNSPQSKKCPDHCPITCDKLLFSVQCFGPVDIHQVIIETTGNKQATSPNQEAGAVSHTNCVHSDNQDL